MTEGWMDEWTDIWKFPRVLEDVNNRLPKGNMWSAIPVALLCNIVNWNERQGSVCLSVCPPRPSQA